METTRLCPQCQQPLAADAPSGLCPQCLLKAAAGPPPSASGAGLAADNFIDIGDPAEVARKLPQFEILEMLGRGGMGVVYKARQRNLDRIVALKILPPGDATSPDFVARFTREARALAKLNHPNIVNVHDFGETSGLYYIIMEYVDGMNLRQLLQTRRLTPAEALAIVPKICDALEYAHEEGLVHRDIKPENLLLDKKGRVKIADFGLAKLLRREPLDMTLTLSGMALGTLRYMAPEQMDKPETVDHRADLYSLGVVIYEMLTGETPVGRFELPSQKAQVDARLDEIVLHALEKEPARRYQYASEIRTDVENVTSKPVAAPAPKSDVPVVSEPLQAIPKTSVMALGIWRLGEIFVACVGAIGLLLAARYGIVDISGQPNPYDKAAVPAMIIAAFGVVILLVRQHSERPSGIRVSLPLFTLFALGISTGALPWPLGVVGGAGPQHVDALPWHLEISAWRIWHGAAFSIVYFALALVHLIAGSEKSTRLRAGALLAGGLAGLVLVFICTISPPSVSGTIYNQPTLFVSDRVLAGLVLSGALALLTTVIGAVQLRNETAPANEPQTATDGTPVESEAVRRARASWFGRRSERFRTLLPPTLVCLELVFILASFAGWPSPWLEMKWTYTPHKHGVVGSTSSYAFHPFTFSFLLLLIGFALPFLAGRFSQIDNLVRYGRRFRELQKEIRRKAKLKIFSCLAAAILLPFLIANLFEVITSGGVRRVAGATYYEFRLGPNSKAYEELLIDMPFYSISENGVDHYRRPNQWDMAIGLKTKDSAEPVTMDIEMPSLRASYVPSWSKDYELPIVLDLAELTKWMSDRGKLDVKDEKVKKEAVELMALLKQFSRQAPAEMNEFFASREEVMPDFWFSGMRGWPGKTGSFSSMIGNWFIVIFLASALIFLALYFVVGIRIQRAAFALDREVREHGESVLARGPLPRVKFGALPRDIRMRTIRRAVFVALGLLLLPALAVLMESAQPKHVKETYYYGFVPRTTFENGVAKPSPLQKHFQEVIMTFAFESYERDGEKWFVQPHPFLLELTFCRPKNFSDKPGEFNEVIPHGKGVPEGETFSFTVELPGLHANMDYISNKSSVTLDEEELLLWMENTIATTTERPTGARSGSTRGFQKPDGTKVTLYSLPMSETPELKSFAADLMAFLKKYATSAPATHDSFMAAARKIPSLNGHSATGAPREYSTHAGVAIIPALAAAILIFLALLPLLKRSAVRAAVRQGTLDIAPQTPVPASDPKPGEQKIAVEPRLSRLALWGAICAPLFFIAATYLIFRTALIDASGHPIEPAWWQLVLGFALPTAGALTPFVATILGAIAIAQIKRSNGKLYGLRLAAIDALLFPLIALFTIVATIAGYVVMAIQSLAH